MIVRDSIVWHVRATLAKGKVHTHCFPGARVLDDSVQIPAILKGDKSTGAVVLHAGMNWRFSTACYSSARLVSAWHGSFRLRFHHSLVPL